MKLVIVFWLLRLSDQTTQTEYWKVPAGVDRKDRVVAMEECKSFANRIIAQKNGYWAGCNWASSKAPPWIYSVGGE